MRISVIGQKEIEKLLTSVALETFITPTVGSLLGIENVKVFREKVNNPLTPIVGMSVSPQSPKASVSTPDKALPLMPDSRPLPSSLESNSMTGPR